jgi:NADPH:quinone reductase-like Zn-dependent oxidoreductase
MHAMLLSPFVPQRLAMVMNKEHYSGLDRLASLATENRITSFMDQPYSLAQAPDAVHHLAAGQAMGKVVITIAR